MTIPPRATRTLRPRMILVDDNIRDVGGHFFELATLLLHGAEEMGFKNVLATHATFDEPNVAPPSWQIKPTFQTRRMVRWSLGVDGDSKLRRDFEGRPVGGSHWQNLYTRLKDRAVPPHKRPQRMLNQWSSDLGRLLTELRVNSSDSLLVNTGDDFAMLALADAIKRLNLGSMRIDVLFHFALYESAQPDRNQRLREIGKQLRSAFKAMQPHRVHLHATTDSLAEQLRKTDCGNRVSSIPYPTRQRGAKDKDDQAPIKAVLAGLPRAEKGRGAISELLVGVETSLLKTQRFQVSMQMPEDRWRQMVPKSLHRSYEQAVAGKKDGLLEVMTSNLSTQDYHAWLDTADLGLFLYDPDRYVARCSGVLLEMLARGVPVIVPDGCWLADQVRLAGGHRSIGFIYQDRAEIPDLMRQFAKWRGEIQARSISYAQTIRVRHNGTNTLQQMGIEAVDESLRAA